MKSKDAIRLAVVATAFAALIAGAAPASGAVLYDQTDNPGADGTFSQFSTTLPNADVETADDFAVPAGQTWTIQSVDVSGVFDGPAAPVPTMNVYVYLDSVPGGLPGLQAFAQKNVVPSNGTAGPDFSLNVNGPTLAGGHAYWLVVQANLDGYPAFIWDWKNRAVQSGSPAAFRDTAGNLLPTCADFTVRSAPGCPGNPGQPDQMFRLNGVLAAPPLKNAGKKKCKKKKKGKKRAATAKKKKKCKKKKGKK